MIGVLNAVLPMQDINERIFKVHPDNVNIKDLNLPVLEVDENIPFEEAQIYFDSVKNF